MQNTSKTPPQKEISVEFSNHDMARIKKVMSQTNQDLEHLVSVARERLIAAAKAERLC